METVFIPQKPLNTAVLFLVFNRLNTTKQVFDAIRQAKPPKLYIAADGARKNKEGETEKVKAVRDHIINSINWECEVKTLFREENLGCKHAVSEGITWFFENEEQGIILEDDCLPSNSFFYYCETLLEKYRDDERIFLISGYNKQEQWKDDESDYFFSYYGGIWGWASWKRAWNYYDIDMKELPDFLKKNKLAHLLGDKQAKIRSYQLMNYTDSTWDYQWGFARHLNSGMACVPSKSLIANIGFGDNATHTHVNTEKSVQRHEISFPLKQNSYVIVDRDYDDNFFREGNILNKIKNQTKKLIRKF